ncbi:hypothetical protein AB0F46_29415 [Streptomyces sp. NPDC026665]|uniref:hypothetical protein n=1 Tax=Streptomyces sp. NPDC026665 TaxID=3154798 RepID=UPI0033E0190E
MRLSAVLAAGTLAAALLTGCTDPDYDCEAAALRPSPVAQAAPIAPDRPTPPRPRARPISPPKAKTLKPKPKPSTTTPHYDHHHDHDHDHDHDCDDD